MKLFKIKNINNTGWGFVLFVLLVGMFSTQVTYAEEDHAGSVEENIEQILVNQSIEDEKDIVCEDVSKDSLERLGDAVMGRMIGNDALHTQMDRMMGGEGSVTLNAMHTHLARMYLGCNDSGFGMGMMMGGGMMQSMMGGGFGGMMNGGGMMQSQGFSESQRFTNDNISNNMMGLNTMGLGFGGLGSMVMITFWVLIILFSILLVQKLMKQSDEKKNDQDENTSALDILKERYAKGEIEHDEFMLRKNNIR